MYINLVINIALFFPLCTLISNCLRWFYLENLNLRDKCSDMKYILRNLGISIIVHKNPQLKKMLNGYLSLLLWVVLEN